MTKHPSIEELNNNYKAIEILDINDPKPFFRRQAKESSWLLQTHLLLFLVFGIWYVTTIIGSNDYTLGVKSFFGGMATLVLVLAPIHEGIHAIAFKILGAPKVGFKAKPKKLTVFTTAFNFVIDKKQMIFAAVLPFAIITPALISLLFIYPEFKAYWLVLITIHTNACSGDMIIINLMLKTKTQLYTYDSKEMMEGYYFVPKTEEDVESE